MKKVLALVLAMWLSGQGAYAEWTPAEREFRGAWLHTVYQGQYARQSTEENKQYLRSTLDSLKAAGVNAVIFQVRPSADAFYHSNLEDWSRFLSGKAGVAPKPAWDPLEFMVEEAHARGMELHAWLNPYRATTSKNEQLPKGHLARRHPGRFIDYADGKKYFDPGQAANREWIARVVGDIVRRYDVDAIHFDDYFYPYPSGKAEFHDEKSYAATGRGMDLGDWRRHNVDLLIEQVSDTIREAAPWVRFGISPFGIWRNESSDPRGSATNGLENYDSLYADVLLWAEKGWIDYLLPQLYWTMDNKAAAYSVLLPWWDGAVPPQCHLYIGQDVERTMKASELDAKLGMMADARRVKGLCWWPGYSVASNSGGIADELSQPERHGVPLPVPSYPSLGDDEPMTPGCISVDGLELSWSVPEPEGKASDAVKFVVYKELEDGTTEPVVLTGMRSCVLPGEGAYYLTSLSRTNIESAPSEKIFLKKL